MYGCFVWLRKHVVWLQVAGFCFISVAIGVIQRCVAGVDEVLSSLPGYVRRQWVEGCQDAISRSAWIFIFRSICTTSCSMFHWAMRVLTAPRRYNVRMTRAPLFDFWFLILVCAVHSPLGWSSCTLCTSCRTCGVPRAGEHEDSVQEPALSYITNIPSS